MEMSHPTRVRGLKFTLLNKNLLKKLSHPTRVRGLKFIIRPIADFLISRTPHGCVD